MVDEIVGFPGNVGSVRTSVGVKQPSCWEKAENPSTMARQVKKFFIVMDLIF
jgi:hypothetical protein